MANINVLAIISIVLTGVAMVFDTIGLAIPYWYVQTLEGEGSWSYGLWDACVHDEVHGLTQCADVITFIIPRDITRKFLNYIGYFSHCCPYDLINILFLQYFSLFSITST